jgi:hypothetical protein
MSLFIYHTADSLDIKPYNEILSKYSPIYFGINDKTKNFFFDGKTLNFKATLPSYIKKNGIVEYAEKYEKNVEEIYSKLRSNFFDKYCYFLTRANGDYLGGVYDYLYYFRIHVKASIRFLDENNIKFIFLASPSMGFDNIIYEVSKIMKIHHVGLVQIHNNRFFWVKNWSDFGTYSTSLPIFPSYKINVKQKIYDPYFMIRVQNLKNKINYSFIVKKYLSYFKDFIIPLHYAINFIKLLPYHYLIKKVYKPIDWLFLGNKLRFFAYKFIQRTSNLQRLKLEKKFFFKNDKCLKILFYLKVQPEATEAYADTFCDDQLLILDKLQNISPPNTKIYIKEHPDDERNDPMARANFWNSIQKRKNVSVLPVHAKSSSLLKNFNIIATIDGTVGWEAIKNFKPVICFGKPWYLLMPGAFEANKVSNLKSVLEKKWTLKDINEKFTKLTKKMGVGYVCHVKDGTINAYDEFTNYKPLSLGQKLKILMRNDQVVAKSFFKILENITYKKIRKKT